jgi:glycosyltransferase involved in cell wall biosynthesis
MSIKISIITPSYNQGSFIEETILSVINQSYNDYEYIIIDGGSTDNTVDVIKRYEDKITYWVSEPDEGQTHAINKGFRKATGDVISWLNSDDLLTDGALQRIANQFKNNANLACLFGQWQEFDKDGDRPRNPKNDVSTQEWLYTSPYAQPSTFYKRSIFKEIGYLNESLHFSMDNDLFKRIVFYGYNYKYTNEIYSKFRWHDDSKSSNLHELCRANDALIYQTILESIDTPVANDILQFLKQTQLYQENSNRYIINIPISEIELKESFTLFILFYIGRWYNTGLFNYVNNTFKFIKQLGTFEIIKSSYLNTIYLRNKYIPNSFIKLTRRLNKN